MTLIFLAFSQYILAETLKLCLDQVIMNKMDIKIYFKKLIESAENPKEVLRTLNSALGCKKEQNLS